MRPAAKMRVHIGDFSDDELKAMTNEELIKLMQTCNQATRVLAEVAARANGVLNRRIRGISS